jgi:uncharacterized membrane protein (DUF2068 family)
VTTNRRLAAAVRTWVAELNVNPERRLIPRLLSAILHVFGDVSTRTVVIIGIGALLFGALEITEAVGLARRRRWAEYLTVIAGCIGVPFEVSEVIRHPDLLRIGILLINIAIVLYLAWQKHLFGLQGGVETETARRALVARSAQGNADAGHAKGNRMASEHPDQESEHAV